MLSTFDLSSGKNSFCYRCDRQRLLVDLYQQSVVIAIKRDFVNGLEMSGGFTLKPELLTRTAKKTGLSALQCLLKRLLIHIGEHQNLAVLVVLDNCRD